MATAAGTECKSDRKALYCRALSDLSIGAVTFAFEKTLKNLGQFLPSIEEIRKSAQEYRPVDPIAETRKLLSRDDKPPSWEEMGRKSGITPAEIAQWLEEGKAQQRAHMAKLHQDPEWRREAARFGVPLPPMQSREPGEEG